MVCRMGHRVTPKRSGYSASLDPTLPSLPLPLVELSLLQVKEIYILFIETFASIIMATADTQVLGRCEVPP